MAVTAFGTGYLLAPGDTLDAATVGHPGDGQFRARVNQFTVVSNATGGTTTITCGGEPKPVTITIATPGVFTSTAHGRQIGSPVRFSTTGALPTGLTAGTTYYIISAGFTANAFQVAATIGGTAINTSVSQSGAHTMIGGAQLWTKALGANLTETISAWGASQELDNIHLTSGSTNTTLVVFLSI